MDFILLRAQVVERFLHFFHLLFPSTLENFTFSFFFGKTENLVYILFTHNEQCCHLTLINNFIKNNCVNLRFDSAVSFLAIFLIFEFEIKSNVLFKG